MNQHDIQVISMMFGTMIAGAGLVVAAYGAGIIWRSWGWWNL